MTAADETLDKKTCEAFARTLFEVVEEALLSDKFVKVKGFGTFKLVAVSDRESVNINTGERFQIEGHTKVSFIPDNTLRKKSTVPLHISRPSTLATKPSRLNLMPSMQLPPKKHRRTKL